LEAKPEYASLSRLCMDADNHYRHGGKKTPAAKKPLLKETV